MNLKSLADTFPAVGVALRDFRDRKAAARLQLHEFPGGGFSLWGGNYLAAGFHEAAEIEAVAELLGDVDVLVDVGANSGLFACLAASRGVPCIAVEPMPANVRILLKNIRHNGFERLVEVLPVAVSGEVGVLPLYGRGQGGSLVARWGGQPQFDQLLVPVNTLDGMLADRLSGKRVALKVDVEGAELSALQGASRLLASRPPLLLELSLTRNHPDGFNPQFALTFQTLWALGYQAQVADRERTPVDAATVARWVAARRTETETENFLFTAAPSA